MAKAYIIKEAELRDILLEGIRSSLKEADGGNNFYPSTSKVNYKIKGPFRKRSTIRNAYDQYHSGVEAVNYRNSGGQETADDITARLMNDKTYQDRIRQMQGHNQAELARYQEQMNQREKMYQNQLAGSTGANWVDADDNTKQMNITGYINQCVNQYMQNGITPNVIYQALWSVLARLDQIQRGQQNGNVVNQQDGDVQIIANEEFRRKYAPMVDRMAKTVIDECRKRRLM